MGVALITGASSGIGWAAALEMAKLGYHVVAAGRSERRTAHTVEAIRQSGGSAEFLHLDLASLDSCRAAASRFVADGRQLDVLVNNAGVGPVKGLTRDGYEIHFGVNHLGHFMFTHGLRDCFRPGTRLVQVSSQMHHRADGIDFARLQEVTGSFFGLDEYGVSKLANILFVREFARRNREARAYAVHPGLVDTRIIPWYVRPVVRLRALTPRQGADTVVWCATAPELAQRSGLYYSHRSVAVPSAAGVDDRLAERLWEYSEGACGLAPPV